MSSPTPAPPALEIGALAKYNPHLWSATELRAIFVARNRELELALDTVRAATKSHSAGQHLLITGMRGMGKTTLLLRLALAVEDDAALSGAWLPLRFPEELYTVATLGEFWARVWGVLIDHLAAQGVATQALDDELQRLDTLDAPQRAQRALTLLDEWCAAQDRRLILLVDNTDLLLDNLAAADPAREHAKARRGDSPALWGLRDVLQRTPWLLWIGGSYQPLEASGNYGDAFLDFFRLIELRPLSLPETEAALLALACAFAATRERTADSAEAEMRSALAANPARLKALRDLTGGNPRAMAYLYELFLTGGTQSLRADLERMLDAVTPLYKHRLEALPPQTRKVFAHLMEAWDPVAAGEVARAAHLSTATVSTHLARLQRDGLIDSLPSPRRRSRYQASERLFNVWYLMRLAGRSLRVRLHWLVEFLRLWYGDSLLTQQIGAMRCRLAEGGPCGHADLLYARALSLTDATDASAASLAWQVFRIARNTPALAPLFDDVKEPRFTQAADYLSRFEALRPLLEASPHAADDDERRRWADDVQGALFLSLAAKERVASASLSRSEFDAWTQVFAEEARHYEARLDADAWRRVRRSVLDGAFFPDCPIPDLAVTQLQGPFAGDARAHWFALNLVLPRLDNPGQRAAIEEYLAQCGDDAAARNLLGNVLSSGAHASPAEAEAAYRKAIELDAKSAHAWNGLGNLLQDHLARYDEAEAAYRTAIELDPQSAAPWHNLGKLLQDHLGRYDEAEAACRKAIELDPRSAHPWNGLGKLLQDHLARYDEAEAAYRKAIELDPKFAYPWNGLGNLLQRHLARYDEAEAAYRKAIELDPKFAHPRNGLGNLLKSHLAHYDEAEAAYRKAIELDPRLAYPWNGLGNLLQDHLARYDEAEAAYRKAIELDPRLAQPWNSLGNLLQNHLARYDEAEAAYRKAIELEAKSAAPWNGLGNLLQDHRARYDEAEAAYRRAIELDPKHPYPQANLARLLAVRGERESAAAVFRTTLEMTGKGDDALRLQANLWLGNRDAAAVALLALAGEASAVPRGLAFQRIAEQCFECQQLGLGTALAQLMDDNNYRQFLLPFALALRVVNGDDAALAAVAPEYHAVTREIVARLRGARTTRAQ